MIINGYTKISCFACAPSGSARLLIAEKTYSLSGVVFRIVNSAKNLFILFLGGRLGSEAFAQHIVSVLNDHKAARVDIADDLFDFGNLGEFGDYQQHLALLVSVGTFGVKVGHASANYFDDAVSDFFIMFADDNDVLFVIKAVGKSVAGLKHNKEG